MNPWRITGWSIAALLLLLPLVAMQFTREVNWTASDFVFAGVLLGAVGLAAELTVRRTQVPAYRAGVGLALAAGFLTVWADAAVGLIGEGPNAFNLLFLALIPLALVGAAVARFRAVGMARTMALVAIVDLAIVAAGLATDPRGGLFSMSFALPWLLAAVLFQRAARQRPEPVR